jgi:hypothetical protein
LRADGFIIRAQATIRMGGFFVRAGFAKTCALRAPTLFSARMKSTSVQKTRLWIKAITAWGSFYTRSPIASGCAFHPRAIDDPRGRLLVRAKNRNSATTADAI